MEIPSADNVSLTPAGVTTKNFLEALSTFHWRADFIRFCEVLGLEADDYAEQKYRAFQELIERLNEFDMETLSRMVAAGGG